MVLSLDGSTPAGTAGAASSSTDPGRAPLDSGLRWLLLLGLMAAAGAFAAVLSVTHPCGRRVAWAGAPRS